MNKGRHMKRHMKRYGIAAIAATAALMLAACGATRPEQAQGEEYVTVRVGYIPGAHDIAQLFVAERAFGVFAGEEIEVGFAHAFFRRLPKRARVGDVVAHDPALEVLEVDVIRQRIHQHP